MDELSDSQGTTENRAESRRLSTGSECAVGLKSSLIGQYRRFSLYNSPYVAHDHGRGIDLYPQTNIGVSPVAGTVRDVRSVGCPDRSYAVSRDYLIVIDLDPRESGIRLPSTLSGDDLIARVLHVRPAVETGTTVVPGDPLGEMVRSGFFGQWVDNHVHLEFRRGTRNPYRAAGSLPLVTEVPVSGIEWDGTGRIIETGPSSIVLDSPAHPNPGTYVALGSDGGLPLDGGLAHYQGGGTLACDELAELPGTDEVRLLGKRVGRREGRDISWADVDVLVGEKRASGLSMFASREPGAGAKLVFHNGHDFNLGKRVTVEITRSQNPIRLG